MHQHAARLAGRSSHIVRAASVEVAMPAPPAPPEPPPEPPPPEPPPPAIVPAVAPVVAVPPENKDAKALRDVLHNLGRQVEEWRSRRRHTIGDIGRLSVEFGVMLAERLLDAEIAADRQRLDRIVQQALARLPAARAVTLSAHPDDIALLQRQLEGLEQAPFPRDALTFRPDGTAARGQMKLDAGEFFVEWDPASALKEMRAALLEENFSA